MSNTIHPGDDFYRACNSKWLKSAHLASYRATYSVSEELEEFLEGFLFKIANEATQKAKRGSASQTAEGLAEDAIGRLVLSSMRPEKQGENVEYLKRGMRGLSCMRDTGDVGTTLGRMIRSGVPTFLSIGVDVVFVEGRREYCLMIAPGSLGLPDPRYYLQIERTSAPLLKQYRELLEFVTREFDLGYEIANGISIEASMAEPLQRYQDVTEYVVRSFAELRKEFPRIPWEKILAADALGIPPEILGRLRRVAVTAPEWLAVVNSFFESLPIEHWPLLLGIHTAVHGIQYLPAPFDQRHYDLFGRAIQGQRQKIPQHILTMNVLKDLMSEYISYFFVKRYLDPTEKAKATKFVGRILDATRKRLSENPWMSAATRHQAIEKVARMAASVFYPEPLALPTAIPALQTDTFLANIYLLSAAQTDKYISRLRASAKPNPEKLWDEPVFLVNAFYYQDLNQIVLPAGNFFWPFYSSDRLGWSYGGLGAIIAHEIVHAFDEEGKDIDEKGSNGHLWSKADERAYQERLGAIVRLFNQAKVGGIFVNGKRTASENLADLGGVAIALDAIEGLLRAKKVGAEERLRELRDFFWSYAVSWRTKERDKKALQDVYMDRHAPPEFRVNMIVPQFDAWYEAFSVQTAHDLYIPPEERIRIF